MKKNKESRAAIKDLSSDVYAPATERFKKFSSSVLGVDIDDVPSEQSIFMKQCSSIVFYATILFLITNGFYLIKNLIFKTTIVIDMVPLYMMVASSAAMLFFLIFYKKHDSAPSRYALLFYYIIIIASVTVFMVSCNYHKIGLSISMCYLFVIMIAPTYKLSDTILVCVLILVSWYLPSILPYAENYNLFKHFLVRFAIIAGFISVRSVFIRQSVNERKIKEMSNAFINLAFNDVTTGTLNKKAMESYRAFVGEKLSPDKVSVIIYDIDNFKSYNDHYSHMQGDEALKHISESVTSVLEKTDLYLFRFGGEEFVVILPDAEENEAVRVSLEMLGAIRSAAISRNDLPQKNILTASFGVSSGTKEELSDLSLLMKADKQLYISKNSGKNSVAASNKIYK